MNNKYLVQSAVATHQTIQTTKCFDVDLGYILIKNYQPVNVDSFYYESHIKQITVHYV